MTNPDALDALVGTIADAIAERLAASTPDRLLTAEEVAELCGVPLRWVRDATRDGRRPHVRLGRYVRYVRDDVLRYLAENTHGGRPYGPHGRSGTGER